MSHAEQIAVSPITLVVDEINRGLIRGWAAQKDCVEPVTFQVHYDNKAYDWYVCDLDRPDVRGAGFASALPGFLIPIPDYICDGLAHFLTVSDVGGRPIRLLENGRLCASLTFISSSRKLVFDVGMSEGNDSAFYLSKGFKVVGIEADNGVYRDLTSRFAAELKCGQITIHNLAASRSDGEMVEFFHHEKYQGISGLSNRRQEFVSGSYTSYEKMTINWAALIRRHGVPHYMKVDIQGGERPFLEGMLGYDMLPQYLSIGCNEFEPVELLYQMGYRFFKLIDQNPVGGFTLAENQMEGNPVESVNWTNTSGPFGRDLPNDSWLSFEQFGDAWRESKPEFRRTWFDCHAWMPSVNSKPYFGCGPTHSMRTPLKWYFAISSASIPGNSFLPADRSYVDMVRVAVKSALDNTDLLPQMIYDGEQCEFTDEMSRKGVNVIFHRLSFADAIEAHSPDNRLWQRIARGTYLRIDAPIIESTDSFILYTDCDVIFLKQPKTHHLSPPYFAAAPEFVRGGYREFNAGVMLLNVDSLTKTHSAFVEHIKLKINRPGLDQSAFREFYGEHVSHLPEEMNWKPYWGDFSKAEILHFHGPKPFQIELLMQNNASSLAGVIKELYGRDQRANVDAAALFFKTLDLYKLT